MEPEKKEEVNGEETEKDGKEETAPKDDENNEEIGGDEDEQEDHENDGEEADEVDEIEAEAVPAAPKASPKLGKVLFFNLVECVDMNEWHFVSILVRGGGRGGSRARRSRGRRSTWDMWTILLMSWLLE